MQKQIDQHGKDEDGVRVLKGRTILAHYAHLKTGRGAYPEGCPVCKDGVDGAVAVIEEKKLEPVVDKGDRSDKEGDAASASAGGWPFYYPDSRVRERQEQEDVHKEVVQEKMSL